MLAVIIVSHSEKAAEGVKEIAEQMNGGKVAIKAAGGAEENRIGTNPIKIKQAIEEVQDADNILVFVDLGSSIIGTEMAVDMLEDEIKKKVKIMDAPLVEGTIAAVIQGTITDDIEDIINTALESKNISKF